MSKLPVSRSRRGTKVISCGEAANLSREIWSISNLVCGILSGKDIPQTLSASCFNISERVSLSLIRVAATRIFANPAQAILELPVNSIDSYRSLAHSGQDIGKIGKFGMGFFSILYWILHHKRSLVILSTYREENGDYCRWQGTITSENEEFFLTLDSVKKMKKAQTGTKISLSSGSTQFSPYETMEFYKQLLKLREIRDVAVFLVSGVGKDAIMITPDAAVDSPSVNISMTRKSIVVSDHAAGIPLFVLFSSLLVPSVSTKTIAGSISTSSYLDHTRLMLNETSGSLFTKIIAARKNAKIVDYPDYSHRFTITVGDVVVVQLEKIEYKAAVTQQYYLSLPLGAVLPVSRDDVILSGKTKTIFKENLIILAYEAIEATGDLTTFFDLVRSYVEYSGQREANMLYDEVYTQIASDPNYVFIPFNSSIRESLTRLIKDKKVVTLPGSSAGKADTILATLLKGHYREDIYVGRKLVLLPEIEEQVTDAGLPIFLFVNEAYVRDNPSWETDIAMSYSKCRLYPHSSSLITREFMERYKNWASWLSDDMDQDPLAIQIASAIVAKCAEASVGNTDNIIIGVFKEIMNYKETSVCENIAVVRDYMAIVYGFWSGVKLSTIYGANQSVKENIVVLSLTFGELFYRSIDVTEAHIKFFWETITRQYTLTEIKHVLDREREGYRFAYEISWQTSGLTQVYNVANICCSYLANCAALIQSRNAEIIGFTSYLLKFIIGRTRSYFEGMTMLWVYLYHICLNSDYLNGKRILPKISSFHFVLEEIRSRYSPWQIKSTILADMRPPFNRLKIEIVYPLEQVLNLYNQGLQYTLTTLKPVLPNDRNAPFRFTARQLTELAFLQDIDVNDISGWALAAANIGQPTIPLQSVEIAVNEGTTKDFLPSVLTELVQNSIDAVRSSGTGGNVEITTGRVGDSYCISVSDPVGIPPAGIFSLLIPFLSTKSTSDLAVTGEMGSGFFNVYRQPWSYGVLVETSTGNQSYRILGLPLIKKRRVVDILYDLTPSGAAPRGTRITVELREKDLDTITSLMASASIFSHNYFGVIPFSHSILFNGKSVTLELTETYKQDKTGIFWFTKNNVPSVFLTNGIPFSPLRDYVGALNFLPDSVVNEISTGYVVNVGKNVYTPVQSRNRIYIDPLKRGELISFFSSGIFSTILERIQNGSINAEKAEKYIPFFASKQSITQLYLSTNVDKIYNGSIYFVTCIQHLSGTTIAYAINMTINAALTKFPSGGIVFTKDMMLPFIQSLDPTLPTIIANVIAMWFDGKIIPKVTKVQVVLSTYLPPVKKRSTSKTVKPAARKERPVIEEEEEYEMEEVEEGPDLTNLQHFFALFSQKFWSIGRRLEEQGHIKGVSFQILPKGPKIKFVTGSGFSGRYISNKHEIDININNFPIYPLKEAINEVIPIYRANPVDGTLWIRENKNLNNLLGVSVPSKSLIHELSHAWRNTVHKGQDSHSDIVLTIDGKRRNYSFDEAATAVYERIIREGLWESILHDLVR